MVNGDGDGDRRWRESAGVYAAGWRLAGDVRLSVVKLRLDNKDTRVSVRLPPKVAGARPPACGGHDLAG